jgi:hypothetical protein
VEHDDPEVKAAVGQGLPPPSIERDADPIQVPVGPYNCCAPRSFVHSFVAGPLCRLILHSYSRGCSWRSA